MADRKLIAVLFIIACSAFLALSYNREPTVASDPVIAPMNQQPVPTRPVSTGTLPDGTFLRNGWWDYGSCNGEDQEMCENENHGKTIGCVKPEPKCQSGYAVAVATTEGDRQCVIQWWRWECQPKTFTPWPAEWEPERIATWKQELVVSQQNQANELMVNGKKTLPPNPCKFDPTILPMDTTVVALGVYEGKGDTSLPNWGDGNRFSSVRVLPGEDHIDALVLVLSAYEPVEWKIDPSIRNIRAIILTGYSEQRISGLDKDIPVIMRRDSEDASAVSLTSIPENKRRKHFMPPELVQMVGKMNNNISQPACMAASRQFAYELGVGLAQLNEYVQTTIGRPIDRFAGAYSTEALAIPATDLEAPKVATLPIVYEQPAPLSDAEIVPPGRAGLELLTKKQLIRPATAEDVIRWMQGVDATLPSHKYNPNAAVPDIHMPRDNTYVIQGATTLPDALDSTVFILPSGVPMPSFGNGNYRIYQEKSYKMLHVTLEATNPIPRPF